jgi:hypothetical protein
MLDEQNLDMNMPNMNANMNMPNMNANMNMPNMNANMNMPNMNMNANMNMPNMNMPNMNMNSNMNMNPRDSPTREFNDHEGLINPDLVDKLKNNDFDLYGQQQAQPHAQPQVLSPDEIRRRKIDTLASLRRLGEQGYDAGKTCGLTTPLVEIEETLSRLTAQRDLDDAIKTQREWLVGFCTICEAVCQVGDDAPFRAYNVFDLDLKGWSEAVFENVASYDKYFEAIYYRWKGRIDPPPELMLAGSVLMSAVQYHYARVAINKAGNQIPGFNDVMQANPELERRYRMAVNNTPNQFTQQPQQPYRQQPQTQQPQTSQQPQQQPQTQQQQQQSPQTQQQRPQSRAPNYPLKRFGRKPPPSRQPKDRTRERVPMSDPTDFDGLLSSLKQPQSQSQLDNEEVDLSMVERLSDITN